MEKRLDKHKLNQSLMKILYKKLETKVEKKNMYITFQKERKPTLCQIY